MTLPPPVRRGVPLAWVAGLIGLLAVCSPAFAQTRLSDDFSDGDFTNDPAWSGTTAYWILDPFGQDYALRSAGPARDDTLALSTPSEAAFGTWRLTVRYEGGALSNFNQIRIFLLSDGPDLKQQVNGYFVQLGTNSRDLRLYRSDAARSDPRVLLAQTDADLLPEDERTFSLEITRSDEGTWRIALDGAEVLTYDEADPAVTSSRYFGLWVKHSKSRRDSYFFDDIVIEGEAGPADTTPPVVQSATYEDGVAGIVVLASEALNPESFHVDDFSIETVGAPSYTSPISQDTAITGIFLGLEHSLADGAYDVRIAGLADLSGNVIRDTTVTVQVGGESDETPPQLVAAEAPDAYLLRVTFDEPVVCESGSYEVSGGIGNVTPICPIPTTSNRSSGASAIIELPLDAPLSTGSYTLTVRNIEDRAGNVLDEAQTTFGFAGADAEPPAPGEIVINEISYAPPDADLEFIELFNRTDKPFDLSRLHFADDRRQFVPVTHQAAVLNPDGYAVLVRDAEGFADAFPGVPFIEPPSWPALNNSGDAVVLYLDETVIDSVAFSASWGGDGVSLERKDPTGPSNSAANWGASTDPAGATPNRRNSIFEIDTTPPELLAVAVNAAGDSLRATFSEPLDPATVQPARFRITGPGTPPQPAGAIHADGVVHLRLAEALPRGTYTLTVTNVADLRGNVLAEASQAFSFFLPDAPAEGEIVVNEIFYAPPDADLEFIELFNRSDETFDLRQLQIADARLEPVPVMTAAQPLPPGGYAVLVRSGDVFAQAFPEVAYVEVAGWPALNDGGDAAAVLYDGAVIDFVEYEPGWGGSGVSLERRDPAGPSNAASNFGPSKAEAGATPGRQNSVFGPDTTPPQPVFVEQIGPATLLVTFDEPVDLSTLSAAAFALDGEAPNAVQITTDTQVRLTFASEITGTGLVVTGVGDLTGNVRASATRTVARLAQPGDVRINEILFDPLADAFDERPDQPEYVEVYNQAAYAVSLSAAFRTDRPDEHGAADTLRWAPERIQVAPGGYAVFFAQPEAAGDPATASQLALAFPEIDFSRADVTLVPVARGTLSLLNDADRIRLHRADGTVLDEVTYDAAWHHPNLVATRGIALERIAPDAASSLSSNWSSSTAAAGGTPGRPNSIFLNPSDPPAAPGLTVEPSPFSPDGDGFEDVTALRFTLSDVASLVRARIFDAQGRLVRTLEEATITGRSGQLLWDGLDDDGRALRIGIYVVLLEAISEASGTTDAFKRPVVLARPLR